MDHDYTDDMSHTHQANAREKVIDLRWEGHDRHPTSTRLALLGVPVVALVAILGLPPLDIHGPLHYLGVMGPTCGMTRGVMWTARGNLIRASQFNPASLLVIPTMILLTARAAYARLTGRWLNLALRRRSWLWAAVGVLVLLLAVRQQLAIDLLLSNPTG